ncbi:hypothetical protein B0F90DRAFT_1820972 [Multifurca ochricompacta]|uniref:DNA2/NAM7 helicase helicase domain-containing protein n=1 Tax=Multifurca ochricompacta TaxID=376703 RepID=A0AAD4LYP3_9AGAM|nr:hypothetical protein B0F90DRAFT_1820972 [Multifurca ochricompacta]
MVAYCVTALGGGTCIDSACLSRHDISRCDICGCSLPNLILEQHQNGKKHIRNLASQGPRNLGTPQQVPPSQLDHQNPQPAPPPNTLPPSGSTPDTIIASDPRLTVSHKGGLDFKVQGTGNAGNLSFSPASLTILIEKTDMISSLSIHSIVPTPNSCFSASQVGETAVIRHKKPRRILVSFQAPHAGTFRASLKITFSDKSRQSDGEFSVIRELLGRAILPGIPASAEDRSNSATGDTVVASEDTGITVSHESGLQFSLERSQSNVQFTPQTEELVIEKSSRSPLVSFETATVRLPDGSTASCFSAEFHGSSKWAKPKSRRTITVSFAPQQEGLYEAILELTFRNHKRKADFVIQRTLRGVAKQPARGHARSSGSFPANDWADDHASLSSDEEEDLPDSDGTGISVSDEDGVYFGIVERRRTNGPFATPMASLTIQHAKGFPAVTFLKAKINTLDNSDPSFIARFEGDTQTIQPSTESAVQIIFNPKFEGQFEAILELIFYDNHRSTRFVVRRRLRAIAGSVEDHKHFESFSQEHRPRKSRKLPDYELPPIVQAAVDNATEEQPYDKEVPHLIHILRPKELSMDTYAQYFKALLNVDEGHQQRDLMDQPPFEVEVQKNRERYSVEIENKDEDLLPEVIIGDFLWLDDKQDDIRYEARITNADVFTKMPAQFDLYRGATFILRFRLNRITLRRQYHALASSFGSLRRLLFPIVTDIKPLQHSRKLKSSWQTRISAMMLSSCRHNFDLTTAKRERSIHHLRASWNGKNFHCCREYCATCTPRCGVKILACTPSNAAADLLVERLAAAGLNSDELFRLNAYSRYEEDIPEDVQGFSVFPDRAKLLAHRVVLCTCSTAGSLQTLNIPVGHFSHIIVDEAAQAEEPLR